MKKNLHFIGYLAPRLIILCSCVCPAGVARSMDKPRQLTDWRLWITVSGDFRAAVKACFPRQERFKEDCIKSLSERPRKRQLQGLPPAVLALMDTCQKLGVMGVSRV